MAYKFQLGQARLSGSLIQEGDVEGQGAADFVSLKVASGESIGAGTDLDMMTLTAATSIAVASDVDFIVAEGQFVLGSAAVTATAAEINDLAGNAVDASDFTKLSNVTATAAEINDLAGNAVDGADFTKLSEVTATSAELNYLDGADANVNTLVLPASTTISSYAKSFLDDADEAAFKATVNLEIGTDVQAQDAGLQYLADLAITNEATMQEQIGLEIGVDVEPHSDKLTELATMAQGTADAMAALLAAEVIFLDGATAGTVAASKAVVADSNKDISGVRDLFGRQLSASADLIAGGAINAQTIGIADVSGIIAANSGLTQTSGELHLDPNVAGSGLTLSSGVLAIDLSEATAEDIAVADDSFLFVDATDNSTKKESIADLMTAAAGAALVSSAGVLAVNVDDSSIQITGDSINIKSGGVTAPMLAGSIPADKLQFGPGLEDNGGVLEAKVDGSSIEKAGGTLNVKALGVTNGMLAGSIANAKLSNSSVSVVAGDGLKGAGSVALGGSVTMNIEPADFAGTGLEDDGSDNMRLAVQGNGIAGGNGSVLSVNLDGSGGLEFNGSAIRLEAAVAGGALSHNSGVLAVVVDDSSIEITSDSINVKESGVTNDMLAGSIAATKMTNAIFADLETLGAPTADGQFMVASGAGAFAYESANVARTSLGLGTGDNAAFTDLTLSGDLIVNGTTTTINSTAVEIADINILLAKGSANAAAADGAGLTIDGADVEWKYSDSNNDASINGNFWIAKDASDLINIQAKEFHGTMVGSFQESIATFTASGTLKEGVNKAGSYSTNLNMLLPSNAVPGTVVRVKATANTGDAGRQIQITKQGSDTIDGTNASITLESAFAAISLVKSSGSEWMVF